MKTLSVQIQSAFVSDASVEMAVEALMKLADEMSDSSPNSAVVKLDSQDEYINVNFETTDIPTLWRKIEAALFLPTTHLGEIKNGTIVVCEGEDHWNDYLLLYHFDSAEIVDKLSTA